MHGMLTQELEHTHRGNSEALDFIKKGLGKSFGVCLSDE
jgi:hypothetical protein